jgi:hypothetical protein
MWFKLTFPKWPQERQLEHVRQKGVSLGSRLKEGRSVFVYMVRNLFVQIVFKNDQEWHEVENFMVFSSLEKLNSYLEQDFRLAFNAAR